MINNYFLIVILILVILLICHIFQIEKFDEFNNKKIEPFQDKAQLMEVISDKMDRINQKLAKFEEVKPIRPKAFANLFEHQLPEYIEKERGDKMLGYNLFDITQMIQDRKMDDIEKTIDETANAIDTIGSQDSQFALYPFKMSRERRQANKRHKRTVDNDINNMLKSVKSHLTGLNLNLIPVAGRHKHMRNNYRIVINQGCLYFRWKDDKIDYGTTGPGQEKKVCLDSDDSQHFVAEKIENLEQYKVMNTNSMAHEPHDEVEYPFYMITSRQWKNRGYCLAAGGDGVHFAPCDFSKAQRWKGVKKHMPCHCD